MSTRKLVWRNLFLTVHQWLGLGSSLIVMTLCLTGTLLALYVPLEAWVNRDVQRVEPKGQPIALEVLVPKLAAQAEKPYTSVTVPQDETGALAFRQGRDVTYVNPYTGEALGSGNPHLRPAYIWVMQLHRWLLLDDSVGRPITGAATVIFVITLLTGMVLWVPKRLGLVLRAFTFRKNTNWKSWNYDLHVVLGIYALIPLFVMGTSGLYWSYRETFKTVVYRVLDGQPLPADPKRPEPPETSFTALPYAKLVAETRSAYPYAGPIRITFPATADEPVEVTRLHTPTGVSVPYSDRLKLDARTGAVLAREPFAEKTRAEQLLSLIKDVHVGTVFGGLSLAIYILACAIGTLLPVTGVVHWWTKLQARRRARTLAATVPATPTASDTPAEREPSALS